MGNSLRKTATKTVKEVGRKYPKSSNLPPVTSSTATPRSKIVEEEEKRKPTTTFLAPTAITLKDVEIPRVEDYADPQYQKQMGELSKKISESISKTVDKDALPKNYTPPEKRRDNLPQARRRPTSWRTEVKKGMLTYSLIWHIFYNVNKDKNLWTVDKLAEEYEIDRGVISSLLDNTAMPVIVHYSDNLRIGHLELPEGERGRLLCADAVEAENEK